MKRLIIAILLFVIGCIIIGVIKQEYLIHKLLSQLSFNDSEVILYNHYSNILTMRYMRCDLIGGLMGFIIYFLTLHKKLPSLSFWKFLPNMFLYLTIFFYLYFRQLS